MNISRIIKFIVTQLVLISLGVPSLSAQPFTIEDAGELDPVSDMITNSGVVTENFGMDVTGSGDSTIRVRIGDASFDDTYTFQQSGTQLFSYLFARTLAEDIGIAFRRGVFGVVQIDILDEFGSVNDTTTINLDVVRPKSACKNYPRTKVKGCRRVDLSAASFKKRRLLAKKFARSIRGPIFLEP